MPKKPSRLKQRLDTVLRMAFAFVWIAAFMLAVEEFLMSFSADLDDIGTYQLRALACIAVGVIGVGFHARLVYEANKDAEDD